MQKQVFFDHVRGPLFGGSLSMPQVYGTEAILDRAQVLRTPLYHLAYMLATVFHETARTMQPIIETRSPKEKANPSVDAAIKRLNAAFAAGKLPWVRTPYWRKDADGKSWLGRGLVQLTHKRNYERMGEILGVDLVANPDEAMEPGIAVAILFEGMTRGSFTNRPLSDYITNGRLPDYLNARRVINGIESAEKVAGYALKFEQALTAAGYSEANRVADPQKPVVEIPPQGDGGGGAGNPVSPAGQKPIGKSGRFWTWLLSGGISLTTVLDKIDVLQMDWRVQIFLLLLVAGFAVYAIATMPAVRHALGLSAK